MTESEHLRYFLHNYEGIVHYNSFTHKSNIIKNTRARECRFCGILKNSEEFRKKAHAIPELLGNKRILIDNECDSCNEFFGKQLENHLANFLSANRTFEKIKGKNGIPKYKNPNSESTIIFKNSQLDVNTTFIDDFLKINANIKSIRFKINRKPYIPIAVFKTFVKMILSLLPQDQLTTFSGYTSWILEKEHTNKFGELILIHQIIPDPPPYTNGFVLVLERKSKAQELPLYQLVIGIKNSIYQIALPTLDSDKKHILMPFPITIIDEYQKGKTKIDVYDLSKTTVVKNDFYYKFMRYE